MQPTFETEHLLVRPRTLADVDDCLAMDRDPEVTRFVSGPWSDGAAHRAFIEQRTRHPYPPGLGYWTIVHRTDPRAFVGWVLLIPVDTLGPEIEIGWRLRRQEWGRGLATEAALPVLTYAFTTLKLPEVIAAIRTDNVGSLKVAEKLGMLPRGLVQHLDTPAIRYALKLNEIDFTLPAPCGRGVYPA